MSKDKRFTLGIALTISWIAFSVYIVFTKEHPGKLNEWGDFVAGFCSPLAFLWLVLGYLQQGEELRNSAQALHLQATELKNSVDQQSALVEVSRQQLQQEIAALEDEKNRRLQAALPIFVPQSSGSMSSGGPMQYNLQIRNVGATVTSILVNINPPPNGFTGFEHAAVATQQAVSLGYLAMNPISTVSIEFNDAEGVRRCMSFVARAEENLLTFENAKLVNEKALA